MKTILITGATGFTGRFLVHEAIIQGFRVIAATRKSSNNAHLIERNVAIVNLTFHDRNLLDNELKSFKQDFGTPNIIIHNAGLTQSLHAREYFETNATNTENFIQSLIANNIMVEKFIYTSSLAAAGPGDDLKMECIKESQILNPVTNYGKSKLKAEQLIQKHEDLPWIIVRPTAIYGPGDKNTLLLFKIIKRGFEIYAVSKRQMLSFIYVEDFARGILLISKLSKPKAIYNISDGNNYTSSELNSLIRSSLKARTIKIIVPIFLLKAIAYMSEILSKISGKISILSRDKLQELVAANWKCDCSKIKNEIGFEPKTDLASGINQTAKWYKENGWI